jgi:hypothetical protein
MNKVASKVVNCIHKTSNLVFSVLTILQILIFILITTNSVKALDYYNTNNANQINLEIPNDIIITEIMFNPEGSDTGNEWIEIYSKNCVNISDYKLYEENVSHKIYYSQDFLQNNSLQNNTCIENCEILCGLGIIANNPQNFIDKYLKYPRENNSEINFLIYKSSFALKNDGEDIGILKNNEFIDYIDYSNILEIIEILEGYSLELNVLENEAIILENEAANNTIKNILNNSYWSKSENAYGNPGNITIIFANNSNYNFNLENNSKNYSETYTGNSNSTNNNSNNTNNTNFDNSSIMNNSTKNYNEKNNTKIENISCKLNIEITLKNPSENNIYENNKQLQFKNEIYLNISENKTIKLSNYSIEYWIEDIHENVIKNKIITANSDYKSYTPKIKEKDSIIIIKNKIITYEINSDDLNLAINNNYTENSNPKIECLIQNLADSSNKIILIKNSEKINTYDEICQDSAKDLDPIKSLNNCAIENKTSNIYNSVIQKPIIKIVDVCSNKNDINYIENMSQNSSENSLESEHTEEYNSLSPNYKAILEENTHENNTNNYIKNSTIIQNSKQDLITSAVIYKSQIVKNKISAVIILIILIIFASAIYIYKYLKNN